MVAMSRISRRSMENGDTMQGTVPVPDPTKLTTDAVDRLEVLLREVIDQRVDRLSDKVLATLAEQDKAVVLLRTSTDKIPYYIKESVETLRALHQVQFDSISLQFKERDVRMEQSSKDNKVAIDAALQAQEKSANAQYTAILATNAKSELNFTKLIDGIDGKITILTKTFDDKLSILRDVLTALSNQQVGTTSGITAKEDSSKAMWVIVGVIGGIAVSLIPMLMSFMKGP